MTITTSSRSARRATGVSTTAPTEVPTTLTCAQNSERSSQRHLRHAGPGMLRSIVEAGDIGHDLKARLARANRRDAAALARHMCAITSTSTSATRPGATKARAGAAGGALGKNRGSPAPRSGLAGSVVWRRKRPARTALFGSTIWAVSEGAARSKSRGATWLGVGPSAHGDVRSAHDDEN